VLQGAVHISDQACSTERHISRVNHSVVPEIFSVSLAPLGPDLTAEKPEMIATDQINRRNCDKPDVGAVEDLRGMPADLSKLYEPWPDYDWLGKQTSRASLA
jgi:hypothetical protein